MRVFGMVTAALLLAGGCSPPPEIVTVTPPPVIRVNTAAGAGAPSAAMKAMYQMDAQHSGRSPFGGVRQAVLLRTFDTTSPDVDTPEPGDPGPDIQGSAAIDRDGMIYVGNLAGTLYALRDPGSGANLELVWRFHPAGASPFLATPAIGADGTVYLGFSTGGSSPEARGAFYALRPPSNGADAQVVWSVDFGPQSGRQTSSPTLAADGTIYVPSGAGTLYALAPNGSTRWTIQTGPSAKAAPAIGADGTIYLSSMDGKLYAVAPPSGGSEGTIKWTFDFGAHRGALPVVAAAPPPLGFDGIGSGASPTIGPDGTIYVGANNSNFYAVTPTGALKWLFEAQRELGGIWSSGVLSPDSRTLYFGANKGGIYALNAANGALRWRFDVFGSIYTSPVLDSRGTLYTGSTVGFLFALDAASGQRIFDYDAGGPIWSTPSIRADGSLVIGDAKGRVMLLGGR